MSLLAESYILKVNLPYSEYWLPLAIGLSVGLCAISMAKLVFGRKKVKACPPITSKTNSDAGEHDPFTEGSTSEKRKSFRRQGNPTEVYVAFPDRKEKPFQGWVLDRSMGGLCLTVRNEMKPGTPLAVLPVNAPNMTPWVDIEVRSCKDLPDGYELGCQFLKTPNWSILLMFG